MNIDIVYILVVIVVVFASMVIHELMHGLTAYWLGDTTAKDSGRLTLNPIKHIDPVMTIALPVVVAISNSFFPGTPIFGGAKPVPFRPDRVKGGDWGAALVSIVGPLTNLAIALLLFLVGRLTGFVAVSGGSVLFGDGLAGTFFMAGIMVNLGFFAFNILPIPPLDGSRVLYAAAPNPMRRILESMENMGLIIIFALLLIASNFIGAILSAIINWSIGVFITIT
jgi:Zn-dependent protease